ncbi:MAG: hypothetical protein ACREOO_21865 [bacterium]
MKVAWETKMVLLVSSITKKDGAVQVFFDVSAKLQFCTPFSGGEMLTHFLPKIPAAPSKIS